MRSEPTHMMGKEMIYDCERHGKHVGVVVGYRRVDMVSRTTGKRSDGWRFTIRKANGRMKETCGMPAVHMNGDVADSAAHPSHAAPKEETQDG
jgi:hypothetical protein